MAEGKEGASGASSAGNRAASREIVPFDRPSKWHDKLPNGEPWPMWGEKSCPRCKSSHHASHAQCPWWRLRAEDARA
eukprot:5855700-Alexandrium_andersonii.AAC.1